MAFGAHKAIKTLTMATPVAKPFCALKSTTKTTTKI